VQLNGDDEKLRVGLADAYTRAGRLKDAANQLLSVAKKRPQYNLHLARLYAEMGDAAGAKERAALAEKYFVDKSLENPENPDLVEPVADAMMLQGKWEEALRYVSRRITDESRSRNLRSRIHTVASDALMKDPATQIEAVRHLYRALEAAPINRVALLKLARLAPQIIQISPRDAEPIRHWLTQAYESTPDDLELTALLGLLHMQPGGDLQQAETCLAKAAEKEPILLLDLAQVQERLQKPDASTATLQLAVEKLRAKTEPNEATYFALSEALSRLGNFPEAEKLLVEATEKFPSPLLRTGLSQIYYREAETQKQEDLSARIGYLISAVRVSQGHPPSEAKLAEIALASPEGKAGVTDAANELVTTGKAIRGGHMVLGVVAAKENRWNDAVFHFEQAVSQAGDDAALLNNLAWALAKRNAPGDAKRSLELAEMAVQRAPQNPDIRETRGLAWLVNRQWNRAISDLEFALASFPDRKHLHLLLADAYRGAGNISMAEKHAQLAQ
jgi:tetratricopeptide (TPR) repeat protein